MGKEADQSYHERPYCKCLPSTTYVDGCDSLIFDASLFNHQYGFVNLLLRKFTSLEEMSKYKNDYSRIECHHNNIVPVHGAS